MWVIELVQSGCVSVVRVKAHYDGNKKRHFSEHSIDGHSA